MLNLVERKVTARLSNVNVATPRGVVRGGWPKELCLYSILKTFVHIPALQEKEINL